LKAAKERQEIAKGIFEQKIAKVAKIYGVGPVGGTWSWRGYLGQSGMFLRVVI
jgi:hypothetical protein